MKNLKVAGLAAFLLVLLAFPQVFKNPAITTVAFFTLIYATATTAWNIFSGYTGYIALGHAAYFGIGSYAMAILCKDWSVPGGYLPFLLLPVAGLIAAGASLLLGWISLRTRKHTFVVITIAIFFIMQLLAFNLRSITNGSSGLSLPIPVDWSGDFFNVPFYYVALMTFLGGLGTLAGPILGAIILEPTQQFFTIQFSQNGFYLIIYGILFLAIILLLPEGIIPTLRKTWQKRKSTRAANYSGPLETGDSVLADRAGQKHRIKL
jgi:ABC-type branched-chain amino acid transport system, permease component